MGVEIKSDIFLEIFQTLINTSYNSNPEFRISSLYTIGYIFDEINPKFLNEDTRKKFLFSIVNNFDENYIEVLKVAINSFSKILPFIKNIFQINELKTQLMEKIFNLNNTELIYNDLLLILSEICKFYYNELNGYDIKKITEISEKCVI